MTIHWFSPPVPIKSEQGDLTHSASSPEAALKDLLKWTKRGPQWDLAVRVCAGVISDEVEPEEARKAFRLLPRRRA
ncbi:DUF982 domain-containing protein [Mesorhizobium sp. M0968]|uniref:DUF982 domain-containing protein n=1 Tax=Mesorhizobium sp. M0968 TaxID=2957037 RepID=UPI00333704F7